MSTGFIKLSKDLLEDEMYFSERFTRMQAFFDLCFLASFGNRTFFKRGIKVELHAGQLAKSEEELADRWQWSRNTVRKFLSELQYCGKIEQQKSRLITVISVKNGLLVEQQNEQQIAQQNEQLTIRNNIDNIDNNNIDDTKKKKERKEKVKKEKDEQFEAVWLAYNKKGSKKDSLEQWQKLSDEEKERVLPHVRIYVSSRDRSFCKDFQRYLRDKIFNDVIVKGNDTIYDPEQFNNKEEYHPMTDGIFQYWNAERKCLMFNGYIDQLNDGYTDDTRPDGAKVAWSMYEWIWSSQKKQWIKQND